MFNPMAAAWADYRIARTLVCLPADTAEHRAFYLPTFARSLKRAWTQKRKLEREAARNAELREQEAAIRAAFEAPLRAMSAEQRKVRIAALGIDIEWMWGSPVVLSDRYRDMRAELAFLRTLDAEDGMATLDRTLAQLSEAA